MRTLLERCIQNQDHSILILHTARECPTPQHKFSTLRHGKATCPHITAEHYIATQRPQKATIPQWSILLIKPVWEFITSSCTVHTKTPASKNKTAEVM